MYFDCSVIFYYLRITNIYDDFAAANMNQCTYYVGKQTFMHVILDGKYIHMFIGERIKHSIYVQQSTYIFFSPAKLEV